MQIRKPLFFCLILLAGTFPSKAAYAHAIDTHTHTHTHTHAQRDLQAL